MHQSQSSPRTQPPQLKRLKKIFVVDVYAYNASIAGNHRWFLIWQRSYDNRRAARAQRSRHLAAQQKKIDAAQQFGFQPPHPVFVDAYAITTAGYENI